MWINNPSQLPEMKKSVRYSARRTLGTRKSMMIVTALIVAVVLVAPALSARAALLPRVNEALDQGGFALTFENWQPFAAGVVSGHYKTFAQLEGAAKFHKQRGTLPDESKFSKTVATAAGKVTGTTPGKTTCAIGQVKAISLLKKEKNKAQEARLKLQYEKQTKQGKKTVKKLVIQPYQLSKKQYDVALKRGVRVGRQAKVCTNGTLTGKTMAVVGNITNLAPAADPDDSGGGGSGGSNEGGGGAAAGS